MKVIVAGAGVGSYNNFTKEFITSVKEAEVVLTSERLVDELKKINENTVSMGVLDTVKYINENKNKDVKVLVAATGDTGFYSISKTISSRVSEEVEVSYMCGIGSLAYFCSKVKIGYEKMKLISLHGRKKSIIPYVSYNKYIFTLTGGDIKVSNIIYDLVNNNLEETYVYIGENLSLKNEKITCGKANELVNKEFSELAVMIIYNERFVSPYMTLVDSDFIRGKSPMTKEGVRTLSVSALNIEPNDICYDIGSGTGSVTCQMALKANEETVYAIEKDEDAIELLKENMKNLGINNIFYKKGLAPEGLEEFPPADKVFIGGSSKNLRQIVDAILEKNPKACFVVTTVTLETLKEATEIFNYEDFDVSISCVNISNSKKLGGYHLMMAENPVYIIKGVKKIE